MASKENYDEQTLQTKIQTISELIAGKVAAAAEDTKTNANNDSVIAENNPNNNNTVISQK